MQPQVGHRGYHLDDLDDLVDVDDYDDVDDFVDYVHDDDLEFNQIVVSKQLNMMNM